MNFLIFKARSINDEDNHFKLALRSKDIDNEEGGVGHEVGVDGVEWGHCWANRHGGVSLLLFLVLL